MTYDCTRLDNQAKQLFQEERAISRLDGWFIVREQILAYERDHQEQHPMIRSSNALISALKILPISVSENAVFVGTQRDAFAQSYALINPNFKVSTFNGYCDPTAVFNDIEPNAQFTKERIDNVRTQTKHTDYVKTLSKVYQKAQIDTKEVAYFIEQVTGHIIPDFRLALKMGINQLQEEIKQLNQNETDEQKKIARQAMSISLDGVKILISRYLDIVKEQLKLANQDRKADLIRIIDSLENVCHFGARNLFDAIQLFILLWQVMCLEQAPNPFAFSVGNADRIFEPYRQKENLSREETACLLKHFLVFFNVGSRSWAISQNILISGKDNDDNDLTNLTSYALLDAYFDMNLPQPILSVKLHKNTPDQLYQELGKFFFTPGVLTPSLFNDQTIFPLLRKNGVQTQDLPDYSVAGCQEPLIMGKDNGNTTNSWLNLPKILELVINDGISTISGERLTTGQEHEDATDLLSTIRQRFYQKVDFYLDRMVESANGASIAISHLKVPFLSAFMGGIQSGIDMRDTTRQGTKYNGSGCLIHGLSVIADSFIAIDCLLKEQPQNAQLLITALQNNFVGYEQLQKYLKSCPKYGNNIEQVDNEANIIANTISDMVHSKINYLGNPFRADWSSPTTHLLYGYWVGATPDGRNAREMLGYGVDPLYNTADNGLGFRMLSLFHLDFTKFKGGYASHLGLNPNYFKANTLEQKGLEFKNKIIEPLFYSSQGDNNPFYLYVNVTTPEILKKVLENPKKYAPSGVYIMRIHGTFVNFLDLSPDVQNDIIKRLSLNSTTC